MWDSNGCILQFNNVIYHLKVSSSMKISLDLVENVRYIARVSLSLHRTSTTNFIEARFWSVIAFLFQLVLQERDLLSFQAQRSFPLLWMKFSTSFFVSRESSEEETFEGSNFLLHVYIFLFWFGIWEGI